MKPFRTSVSQKMTVLYNISLDELIDFDIDVRKIQEVIGKTSEKTEEKINWTNAILLNYQDEVNIADYARRLGDMLDEIKEKHRLNEQDAMLILKDILYQVWKTRKDRSKR